MPFVRRLPVISAPFLDEGALAKALPGLADDQRRRLFLGELEDSARVGAFRCGFATRRGPVEPLAEGWHPWTAIATLAADEQAEAIWLAYLTTFFGFDDRGVDAWLATRVVYSAFGSGRLTFTDVQRDRGRLARLCRENATLFCSLPRGNHRKFEPKDAEHKQGLLTSIASLLALAADYGGLVELFNSGALARERFERLMADFRVVSFGRTGRFDLLVLLGDLGVVDLAPPRLYLDGASGPLEGARHALPGVGDENDLDARIARIADQFGISIVVLEDALCNWQKRF